jgi:hypothetical protein
MDKNAEDLADKYVAERIIPIKYRMNIPAQNEHGVRRNCA